MSTTRLEAFSDGVFAIAATLLIIEVGVDESGRTLASALLQAGPSYSAYAISFLTIGIVWMNHHTVFSLIDRVDRTFLVINVFFLMFVGLHPVLDRASRRAPQGRRPPGRDHHLRAHADPDRHLLQRAPVLCVRGAAAAQGRRRPAYGGGDHPELPPRPLDLRGSHAHRGGEAEHKRRAVRRVRPLLRRRELRLRARPSGVGSPPASRPAPGPSSPLQDPSAPA